MALPELTQEQRRAALAKAAQARKRRAEVRVALKARELTLQEFFDLADEEEALAKMRARNLLEALPRVGTQRAQRHMEEIGISPTRRVRGLGSVQRAKLIETFD